MTSKKDKVKAAKAREAERLYYKDHPEELDEIMGEGSAEQHQAQGKDPSSAAAEIRRRRDSKGRKIPTESERARIRQRQQASDERRERKSDKAEKSTGKNASENSSKSNGRVSTTGKYKTYGNAPRPDASDERGFILTLFLYMKQNPKIVMIASLIVAVLVVCISAAVILSVHEDEQLATDDAKAQSLIGITSPAKEVIDSTGKFDGFFSDPGSGIPYAEMFDSTITAADASALASRGQTSNGDGTFAFNEDISSVANGKVQVDSTADASDASDAPPTADASDDASEAPEEVSSE